MTTGFTLTSRRAVAFAVICSLVILVAKVTDADDKSLAKAKFKEGMAAIEAENYPAALAAFEESYELVPKVAILFNIAMCEKALFRYADSIKTFRRFLSEGASENKPQLVSQAERALTELLKLVGILRFEEAPAGAEVSVDGKVVGKTPFREGLLLDPGQHSVRVEKDGFKPLKTDVTVASGAEIPLRAKLTKVTAWIKVECATEGAEVEIDGETVGGCPFEGEVEPGVHDVAVAGPGMDDFSRQVDIKQGDSVTVAVGGVPGGEGPADEGGSRGLLAAGIATTVVGVGLGAMGLAFNVKGMKDEEAAGNTTDPDKRASLNDDIETDGTLRTVGYVAGGVLVVTGIVLLAVNAKKKSSGEKPVAVVPTPGGVAVSF